MLLQARGRLTAAQISHELEVSIRTVYRDVQALQWAGVPVLGTAGPTGGIELMQGWRSRLTGLTADEAEALFLTGMPGPAADLGLHAAVSSAQRKIAASLPGELGRRARGAQDRFHFDAVGWYRDPDDAPHLGTVASAVFERRQIAVRYARWREPVEVDRVLDPYGIVLKAGLWYLVAASEGRPPHTYRISQVLQARVLETPSVRPDDFDLAQHWATYSRRLQRATSPVGRPRPAVRQGARVAARSAWACGRRHGRSDQFGA